MKLTASRAHGNSHVLAFRLNALVDKLKSCQSTLDNKALATAPLKKDITALGGTNATFKSANGKASAGKHLPLDALPDDLAKLLKGNIYD